MPQDQPDDTSSGRGPDIADLEARVDPELATALQQKIVLDLTDIPKARLSFREGRLAAAAAAFENTAVEREDVLIPGTGDNPPVGVRHYFLKGQPEGSPCLIWIHGGGHVVGEAALDDPVAEQFVRLVGCTVVSVEWRKSPEHPFPSAINDCYAALAWVHRSRGPLGIDGDLIAVGGASSGGGSAAGLAVLARDRGEVPVRYQLLIYPMLDDRNVTLSSRAITHPRLWNRATNILAWKAYLGSDANMDVSPYAAPTRAQDLSGLPPAFVGVGELDLFLDEDIEYAQRLLQAGVPTELHVYPGAFHGFEGAAPSSGVAQRFVRDRSDALLRAFRGSAGQTEGMGGRPVERSVTHRRGGVI
jgi:acetyl esterase/lipase